MRRKPSKREGRIKVQEELKKETDCVGRFVRRVTTLSNTRNKGTGLTSDRLLEIQNLTGGRRFGELDEDVCMSKFRSRSECLSYYEGVELVPEVRESIQDVQHPESVLHTEPTAGVYGIRATAAGSRESGRCRGERNSVSDVLGEGDAVPGTNGYIEEKCSSQQGQRLIYRKAPKSDNSYLSASELILRNCM